MAEDFDKTDQRLRKVKYSRETAREELERLEAKKARFLENIRCGAAGRG